jgi:Xaa-Pro dipeptidase
MNTPNVIVDKLNEAEAFANQLFAVAEQRGYFSSGRTEKEINTKLYDLAFELFGIKKFWHKRIVRSGKNTLFPYKENPPDLLVMNDDILFVDFGPVFENWEADVGNTYVIGSNKDKHKLKKDVEAAWSEGRKFYLNNKDVLTGADFYAYTKKLAANYGWDYGNVHCGHLIGNFPHELIVGEEVINYIHPENHLRMAEKDKNGNERFWIYEIHFIDSPKEIGGFYERFLI